MAKKSGTPTKSEILAQICKDTDLSRKQVGAVFESLNGIIKKSLNGSGCSRFLACEDESREEARHQGTQGINPFTRKR